MQDPLDPFLVSLIYDKSVQRIQPLLKDPDFTDSIVKRLATNTGQSFKRVYKVKEVSEGLALNDRVVSLSKLLGVRLTNKQQSFIKTPKVIKSRGGFFFIGNNPESPVTCSVHVTDTSFNLLGPLGQYGTTPSLGQYTSVSDVTVSAGSIGERFYVSSDEDNTIQVYNKSNMSFLKTISLAGKTDEDEVELDTPVAIAIGTNPQRLYVLCKAGGPTNSDGLGFLAYYQGSTNTGGRIPLYCGKNNGTGLCIQGEIANPKDLCVVQGTVKDATDDIFILNGIEDEVGRFDADSFALKDVYRMPNEYSGVSLGLKRIAVKDNTLYITASNIGKVLAIDIRTKEFLGAFGVLRSESVGESPETLGYFNGLEGIAIVNDNIIVSEGLNNRIQVLNHEVFKDSLNITFQEVELPSDKRLVDITYSLTGDLEPDIVLVDPDTNQEYDIKTAMAMSITHFCIRLKLKASMFSNKKRTYELYPIYILLEKGH